MVNVRELLLVVDDLYAVRPPCVPVRVMPVHCWFRHIVGSVCSSEILRRARCGIYMGPNPSGSSRSRIREPRKWKSTGEVVVVCWDGEPDLAVTRMEPRRTSCHNVHASETPRLKFEIGPHHPIELHRGLDKTLLSIIGIPIDRSRMMLCLPHITDTLSLLIHSRQFSIFEPIQLGTTRAGLDQFSHGIYRHDTCPSVTRALISCPPRRKK